jgi:glucose/arabinose dehydrogenase
VVVVALALGASAAAGESRPVQIELRLVASGLAAPTHAAAAPSDRDHLYVTERRGRVRVVDLRTGKRRTLLDIRRLVATGGLRGFFSLAFHPRYRVNRRFFVAYSDRDGDLSVVEYRTRRGRSRATIGKVVLHVDIEPGRYRHYGGQLAFGPDGRLSVGVGDGGVAGSGLDSPAQDLKSPLGKLIRIDVDSLALAPEIVGYGLRNPWRFSFDRATGSLYIADVGELRWEEIDFVPHGDRRLANFGWDVFEGRERVRATQLNPAGRSVQPIATYRRHKPHCAVIGGHVYRGRAIPGLRGRYFYGDLCSGRIWSFRTIRGRALEQRREPLVTDGALRSFAEDSAGELYVLAGSGLYRLTSAGSGSR